VCALGARTACLHAAVAGARCVVDGGRSPLRRCRRACCRESRQELYCAVLPWRARSLARGSIAIVVVVPLPLPSLNGERARLRFPGWVVCIFLRNARVGRVWLLVVGVGGARSCESLSAVAVVAAVVVVDGGCGGDTAGPLVVR
jgi:hypothetical protein